MNKQFMALVVMASAMVFVNPKTVYAEEIEISEQQQILNDAIEAYIDLGYSPAEAQMNVQIDLMEQTEDQYLTQLEAQVLGADLKNISMSSDVIEDKVPEPVLVKAAASISSVIIDPFKEDSSVSYSKGSNRWGITLTDEEIELLCRIVYHEAGNQYDNDSLGKKAVAAVVLNRMVDGRFGGHTLKGVLSAPGQFTTWSELYSVSTANWKAQLPAVQAVLNGDHAMDGFNYLYFCSGSNARGSRKIQDHWFS